MALHLTLVGLGWLLAAASAVLWCRENPGRRLRWASPKASWRSTVLYLAGMAAAVYGWSNLQLIHHWNTRWMLVAAVVPVSVIAGVVPRIVRWRQLRHTTPQPVGVDSSAAMPPVV